MQRSKIPGAEELKFTTRDSVWLGSSEMSEGDVALSSRESESNTIVVVLERFDEILTVFWLQVPTQISPKSMTDGEMRTGSFDSTFGVAKG